MVRGPIPGPRLLPREASMNRPTKRLAAAAAGALLFAMATSCDDPGAPPPAPPSGDAGFRARYRDGGTLEFNIENPGGEIAPLRLVASNLRYDPNTQELRAAVAIHNAGT